MANDGRRPDRVAEAIREEVARFLAEGAKDPRITGLVTVTAVDVTRDLRRARIFVSILGSDAEKASTLEGLHSLASHLRSRVAQGNPAAQRLRARVRDGREHRARRPHRDAPRADQGRHARLARCE